MKTRSLAVALSLALMLGMAGCGSQQAQQEPQEPEQGQVQQSEPASTAPPVESMEVKNENDTTKPLTELEDIEPEEADGAGILEGAGNAESDLEAVDPFTEVNETVYATGTVNLRSGPSTAHDKVGSLNKSDSVTRVGIGTAEAEGWSRIQLSDGSLVYVSNKYLSTTKPAPQQHQTSKPSSGQQSKPSGGQQSKPSESTQQQQTQQTETPPSSSEGSHLKQQMEYLESQGYTGAGGNNTYSDAEKEILGQMLNGG